MWNAKLDNTKKRDQTGYLQMSRQCKSCSFMAILLCFSLYRNHSIRETFNAEEDRVDFSGVSYINPVIRYNLFACVDIFLLLLRAWVFLSMTQYNLSTLLIFALQKGHVVPTLRHSVMQSQQKRWPQQSIIDCNSIFLMCRWHIPHVQLVDGSRDNG